MELRETKPPRRRDDRIILHFDYDCFYAQVIENRQPALKALPLGIKQKSILATCNYEARRRGVNKLMLIADARRICPELVLADGEDLTPFRDVSKHLYGLLRAYSWNGRVERLGLDEIFLDVTDMVDFNYQLLNRNALGQSFFCLSRDHPEQGFAFDALNVAGCVCGAPSGGPSSSSSPPSSPAHLDNALYARLLLASHLAWHLRLRLEEEGYTSSCGISTNKLLSKVVGSQNKPKSQTTLLTLHNADEALALIGRQALRKVPGIGGKTTYILQNHVLGTRGDKGIGGSEPRTRTEEEEVSLTAGQVRTHPGMSPRLLEKLLGGPGAERAIGEKIWNLLHGVDTAEVKAASDVPTQISIEDTYRGLDALDEVTRELHKLTASLLRRMYTDLVVEDEEENDESSSGSNGSNGRLRAENTGSSVPTADPAYHPQVQDTTKRRRRWLARPRTLRLTTRPKPSAAENRPYNWSRASRSRPLPHFVFSPVLPAEQVVARLVAEALLPMFHGLNPNKGRWHLGLINICVANMEVSGIGAGAGNGGSGSSGGGGRDISVMFRRQADHLRPWTVYDSPGSSGPADSESMRVMGEDGDAEGDEDGEEEDREEGQDTIEEAWDSIGGGAEPCAQCGNWIPAFAVAAHQRYHSLGD